MGEHEARDEQLAQRDEARAVETLIGQLTRRGVQVFGNESADDLGDLAEEVERFEMAVAALGGDSLRNAPDSSMPEDRRLVLPRRRDDESVVRYAARINAATELLRRSSSPRG